LPRRDVVDLQEIAEHHVNAKLSKASIRAVVAVAIGANIQSEGIAS